MLETRALAKAGASGSDKPNSARERDDALVRLQAEVLSLGKSVTAAPHRAPLRRLAHGRRGRWMGTSFRTPLLAIAAQSTRNGSSPLPPTLSVVPPSPITGTHAARVEHHPETVGARAAAREWRLARRAGAMARPVWRHAATSGRRGGRGVAGYGGRGRRDAACHRLIGLAVAGRQQSRSGAGAARLSDDVRGRAAGMPEGAAEARRGCSAHLTHELA